MFGITVLGSGSKGNSIVIHGKDGAILLDVGFSLRETRRRMAAAGVDDNALSAILVSHEHTDHTKGLRVAANHYRIPVYCNRGTGEILKQREVEPERLHLFATGNAFRVNEFTVEPFSLPHDAMDPVGFTVRSNGCKLGVVTDLGHVSHMVCHHLRECDILVVESNHDMEMLNQSSRPWSLKQRIVSRHGHLSNQAGMELLKQILHERTRHVILAHASQDCNRYELAEACGAETLSACARTDIQLQVARQDLGLASVWVEDDT